MRFKVKEISFIVSSETQNKNKKSDNIPPYFSGMVPVSSHSRELDTALLSRTRTSHQAVVPSDPGWTMTSQVRERPTLMLVKMLVNSLMTLIHISTIYSVPLILLEMLPSSLLLTLLPVGVV